MPEQTEQNLSQARDFMSGVCTDPEHTKILVALSGGMDSVALLLFLKESGFNIEAAHVNFGLRGAESDGDALFCTELCAKHNIPIHLYRVEKNVFLPGESVQKRARIIRYEWFEQLRQQYGFHWIVTAHHQDDQAETLVMQGLRRKSFQLFLPIPEKNGIILRPFLRTPRIQIAQWMQQRGQAFRDDSTNFEDVYLRNQIRHHIILPMRRIQPSLGDHFEERARLYMGQIRLISRFVEEKLPQIVSAEGDARKIHLPSLHSVFETEADIVLRYILDTWGETFAIQEQVLRLFNSEVGKKVAGLSGIYYRDREYIRRVPQKNTPQEAFILPGTRSFTWNGFHFSLEEIKPPHNFQPETSSRVLTMDAKRVTWPLYLRIWEAGDKMKPFGLEGKRKVSDILAGMKMAPDIKQNAFVMCSADKIIYVQDYRIAAPVRYRKDTRKVLIIRITPLQS